jgi:alkylhydroperoxidase family enzyme
MSSIRPVESPLRIRDDLAAAQAQMLACLTEPGTWWTGTERRAIALEARAARDCSLCAERKAALSPFSIDGFHEGPAELDTAVVDVIHRIVTDPGRLARSWYEGVIADSGLTPERYVELVSATVIMNAVDVFARAVGYASPVLAEVTAGTPSKERPLSATIEGAWVPQIPIGGDDWTALYEDREAVPQIGRALSLVPAEVNLLNSVSASHYMQLDDVTNTMHVEPGRAIDRLQMELVASRVSAVNECFY